MAHLLRPEEESAVNDSVWSALEQFVGDNFHPDWYLDAAGWPQIVDNFVVGQEPGQLRSLAREIDEFPEIGPDAELHAAMLRMGGFYAPRPEMTYTEWLGDVAARLRQHAITFSPVKEVREEHSD